MMAMAATSLALAWGAALLAPAAGIISVHAPRAAAVDGIEFDGIGGLSGGGGLGPRQSLH